MDNNKEMTEIEECVEKLRKGCKTLVEEFEYCLMNHEENYKNINFDCNYCFNIIRLW